MSSDESSPSPERVRLRFLDLETTESPDGHGKVAVRMELEGEPYVGIATGLLTPEGDLRMGARASLDTIHGVFGEVVRAELRGVKAVRAFDSWVVIASVRALAHDREYRLLGAKACETQEGLTRGAAIAVLDALNRVLEKLTH